MYCNYIINSILNKKIRYILDRTNNILYISNSKNLSTYTCSKPIINKLKLVDLYGLNKKVVVVCN